MIQNKHLNILNRKNGKVEELDIIHLWSTIDSVLNDYDEYKSKLAKIEKIKRKNRNEYRNISKIYEEGEEI